MRLVACVLIVWLTLTGCAVESEKLVTESKDKPTEITLTPVDLFKGDGAKFKSFLGAMSGAIKLRYEGKKPHVNLDIDMWQNGKKVASIGSVADLFFSSDDRASREVEVILSIDTVPIAGQDDLNKIKVAIIRDSGSSLSSFTTPWNNKLTTRGLIVHHEPRTFTAKNTAYVWGMQATSTNIMHAADFSPESLSKLERAIIFSLRDED
ncbi:hypothetical protein [Paenibacillus sp. 481]|uniref:hypothetical protein n=1 Tax=Paenibacillus sp. 481 TaxID=2835869 RepID=UPI001E2BB89C|nr:hypothetical protein [Paenibacillus sp. 481]UHA73441.1 hypothetical protein KIK04_23250 [Paenibacillus sp. 481]